MGMEDYRFALEFKETLARLVKEEVERQRPRYQMATVVSFDRVLRKCTVTFPGDTTNAVVNMGSIQPASVGQVVRVAGLAGDRYIDDVLGVAYDPDPPPPDLSTDWVYLTSPYSNGWVDYGSIYSPIGYRRTAEGLVMLRGLIKSGTVQTTIFVLPTGFRPNPGMDHEYNYIVPASGSGAARIEVLPGDGTVKVVNYVGGGNNGYIFLDGCMFDSIS